MSKVKVCENLKKYISQQFNCSEFGDFLKIRTPLLYNDGDVIDVFVKSKSDGFVITDLGETMRWLTNQMVSTSLSDRQTEIINKTLKFHKISEYKGMFITKVQNEDDISEAILNLSQAIARISDITFTFTGRSNSSFYQEVNQFLEEEGFDFDKNKKYTGSSERIRTIDFYVKTENCQSLIYGLTSSTKNGTNQRADTINSSWFDLKYLLDDHSIKFISLLDDEYTEWSHKNIKLLSSSSTVALWSRKNEFREHLVTPHRSH
jgi:hypothetical protein